MSGLLLIRDLAVVLLIAGGVAWLCQRAGLSNVVGYLVAGIIIGPHTPPFALVASLDQVHTLAQLGLVFLIFAIGLNLNLGRLKRLGLSVVVATGVGTLVLLQAGRLVGTAMGWSPTGSLFLAAMLMVSSSAIIGRVLAELKLTHERAGQLALGMTVLEDVVAIAMLTLLSSLVGPGHAGGPALVPRLGALAAFVVFLSLMSLLIVPRLLARTSRLATPEIRTLLVGGLLLGLGWLAVQAGYSLALGAFVFGAIVGSTRYREDIESVLGGMDQIFGAVFFVAMGMMVDLRLLLEAWPLVLGMTAMALVLRPLVCALGLMVAGNSSRQALQTALCLTPLGELSFVIAQLGVQSAVLPVTAYPAAVGASLLSSVAAPAMIRRAEAWSERLGRAEPQILTRWLEFYRDLLARLRHRQTASVLWRLTGRRIVQTGVLLLFASALILLAVPLYGTLRSAAGQDRLPPQGIEILFGSVLGLVVLAPLIAIWRNVSALAMIVAEAATAGPLSLRRFRAPLETVLRGMALLLLGLWLVSVLPAGWSWFGPAGAVLVALVLVAAVFWRRFVRLQSRLEIELLEQLKRATRTLTSPTWSAALTDPAADWPLDIDEVTLPGDCPHAGKNLGQLALRNLYGCSVIGIDRHGYGIVNPRADTVLYPGDKLLLLGRAEQLEQAARYLRSIAAGPEPTPDLEELAMESLTVPPGSPMAGKSLQELDLIRRFGVQIGGIRRGASVQLSPGGQDSFAPGDQLLVLGSHAQIKEFASALLPPLAEAQPDSQ